MIRLLRIIIQVIQNGKIVGVYEGSSYPNSISNTNNKTNHNTVKDGEYDFNNKSGHKGGTQKGLIIVDKEGDRTKVSGIDRNGKDVQSFFSHFNWDKKNSNIGTSVGKIIIQRIKQEEMEKIK